MTTESLDEALERAWDDHGADAAGVAERLSALLPHAVDDGSTIKVAQLATHVLGEHLGRWDDGLALLGQLASARPPGPEAASTLGRLRASLLLAAGRADERPGMSASDACRVSAMTATALASRDVPRAAGLLQAAVAQAATMPDDDPAVRAVAAFSNGLAGTLCEGPLEEPAPRALMLDAARIALDHWKRAGGWREEERAEYRLARCHSAAGDAATALVHARRCDAIVREHGSEPLEAFFAAEVLARAAQALGDAATLEAAVAQARATYGALDDSDRGWCRETLKLVEHLAANAAARA